jgi:hypothetical protein
VFVEHQATRRRADDATKTENALRTVALPAYLIPELKRWRLACPPTERGLVFPGEPDANGVRGPIEPDKLPRHILKGCTAQGRAAAAAVPRHAPLGRYADVGGWHPTQAPPGDPGTRRRAHYVRYLHPREMPQARRLG